MPQSGHFRHGLRRNVAGWNCEIVLRRGWFARTWKDLDHDSGVRHGRLSKPTRYRRVFPAYPGGRGLACRRRALAVPDRHPHGRNNPIESKIFLDYNIFDTEYDKYKTDYINQNCLKLPVIYISKFL